MKSSLLHRVREHVLSPDYRPQNKSELARALGVPSKDRASFRAVLAEMEEAGEIVRGKKSRFHLPGSRAEGEPCRGTIRINGDRRRRSGVFIPADPASHRVFGRMKRPQLYVPGRFLGVALDGDEVIVEIEEREPPKWVRYAERSRSQSGRARKGRRFQEGDEKRVEDYHQARVIEVSGREPRRIVGTFHGKGSRCTVSPEDSRLPAQFQLTRTLAEAKSGDIVLVRFLEWSDPQQLPTAEMIEILGREDSPGIDILKVIHRLALPLEFPEDVLAEADLISESVSSEEIERREDWREREVFTIDPEDAKDFDDAICVSETKDGGWELAVHIADVAHYVKPGSALDKEARKRGNSVYLADRVIPMLPENLSNGICSLKPGVERLTHAAILEFDNAGDLKNRRFASAVIRSHHRFTYEEAYALMQLDEEALEQIPDEEERRLGRHLARAWDLASLLRKKRFAQGALDLDFPEVRVVLDEKGRAVDLKRSDYDESHQLIEEFMLAANESVASETRKASFGSIYRIHEDPDFGKLEEFADLARTFGHNVGNVTQREELQGLLSSVRGRLEEHSMKLALLKSLKRAAYSKDPLGHYGLAKDNYTHFTSPIRRYADLVVHRVLRRILSDRGEDTAPETADRTPSMQEISEIAHHISSTERIAADAEIETRRLKMIEYLERVCREDPEKSFEATVYEVRPIGAFIELNELLLKGLIRRDDLHPEDGYFFDRNTKQFRSRNGRAALALGGLVMVRLERINREKGFLDFVPV